MGNPHHQEWHCVLPGRWERDVDEPELLYASMAKTWQAATRSYFAIMGYVQISLVLSGEDPIRVTENRVEAALRKAWRRLRYDHPTLASVVEYDSSKKSCKKVYLAFANEAAELDWLDASFKTVNNGQTGLEFCNSDPPVNRHATLYVITPPEASNEQGNKPIRRDIVFRCTHDAIDGIGTLMLLNNLLRHASEAYTAQDNYAEVVFGDEWENLSPSFRTAARIPLVSADARKERARAIAANHTAAKESTETIIGIPFKSDTTVPKKSQRAAIYLGKDETHTILQKCKQRYISVTHAFHAAIAIAVRDIQTKTSHAVQGRYINYCLVNLRKFCTPPYHSAIHPATVYHSTSGRPLVVDLPIAASTSERSSHPEASVEEFSSTVSQIKQFYQSVLSDPEHIEMTPLYFNAITPPYPEEKQHKIPPPNPNPSVSISSMGVIDNIIHPAEHAPFQIGGPPWVMGDEYSTGVGLFLGTWKGEMSLSAGFNEAFHEMEDVVGFLERVKEAVRKGLGC